MLSALKLVFCCAGPSRRVVRVIAEAEQRRHVAVSHQPDVATGRAVTAVGATSGHERLTSKRHTPGAAIASLDVHLGFIDKGTHGETNG